MTDDPPTLTPSELDALLDLHGADLSRWPEHQRVAAERLLGHDAQAHARMRAQQHLGEVLDALPAQEPSPALRRKVAQVPLEHARAQLSPWPLRAFWPSAAIAVATLLLGHVAGTLTDTQDTDVSAELVSDSAEPEPDDASDGDARLEEILALAFTADLPGDDQDAMEMNE